MGDGRGGAYVVGQFALITGIAIVAVLPPALPHGALRVVGGALALAGAALFVWAYRTLGRSFTMLPEPLPDGELVTGGPYRLCRHPAYGAGLLVVVGFSLATSLPALGLSVALGALWWRKSLSEERRLAARFPAYAAYRGRVRPRFLPWLL